MGTFREGPGPAPASAGSGRQQLSATSGGSSSAESALPNVMILSVAENSVLDLSLN